MLHKTPVTPVLSLMDGSYPTHFWEIKVLFELACHPKSGDASQQAFQNSGNLGYVFLRGKEA